MLRLLRIVFVVLLSGWSVVRGAEEAFAYWVRRATRSRDLAGMTWA